MNHDLIDIEIAEALATLRDRYPGQRVSVRVCLEPEQPAEFWAAVEHMKAPTDYQSAYAKSPHEAVEKLVAEVGDHKQVDATAHRIWELRKELNALEEQLAREVNAPSWIKAAGDECTLHAHERGLGGEPERKV